MSTNFDYVEYDDISLENTRAFKSMVSELETHIEAMPDSRAKSLALTKLEETYMWIGKAIRDAQIVRAAKTGNSVKRIT